MELLLLPQLQVLTQQQLLHQQKGLYCSTPCHCSTNCHHCCFCFIGKIPFTVHSMTTAISLFRACFVSSVVFPSNAHSSASVSPLAVHPVILVGSASASYCVTLTFNIVTAYSIRSLVAISAAWVTSAHITTYLVPSIISLINNRFDDISCNSWFNEFNSKPFCSSTR